MKTKVKVEPLPLSESLEILIRQARDVERELANGKYWFGRAKMLLEEVKLAMEDRDDVVFQDMIEKIEDFLRP